MKQNRTQQITSYLFLTLLLFFAFYLGLDAYPLGDNNEGMYAEIAREMLETKQFIIPHLNYLPYLEKPPLLYWLMAGSMWLFGPTTFAARFIPATAALFTCLSLLFWARKCKRPQLGWLAAVILASSFGFVIISRIVFFDMLLTLWLTMSLLFFYLWFNSKIKSYLYASYAFLALAVLTKGVVALALAFPIAVAYLLWLRVDYKTVLSLFNPIGIALFLALVIPWHILAQLQWQDFSRDYFINEQFMRFLDKRVPNDYYHGPIYYYLPRIGIYLLPWSVLVIGLLFFCRKTNLGVKYLYAKNWFAKQKWVASFPSSISTWERGTTNRQPIKPFLYLWFFIPLLFFSLSRAKANYYMVVGLPPLALLFSLWIQQCFDKKIATESKAWARIKSISVYCIASWIFPAMLVALWGLHKYQDDFSKRNFVNYFVKYHPNMPLYLYQDYEKCSSLAFYLRRHLVMVDSKSKDLYYGEQTAAKPGWFINMASFLQCTGPSYIVVMANRKEAFIAASKSKPFCEEITIGNASLFTNVCNGKIPRNI
ncbi:hypothetical protein BH10PSE19_BH10PSE19_01510 [soil metagenome]